MKGVFILSHGALRKENQFFRRKHTDHKKTQRNETKSSNKLHEGNCIWKLFTVVINSMWLKRRK